MYELWRAPLHCAGHWTYPARVHQFSHFTSHQQYSEETSAFALIGDFKIEEFMIKSPTNYL